MSLRIEEQGRIGGAGGAGGSVADGRRNDGMVTLSEDDRDHVLLKHRLYTGIGQLSAFCRVVAVRRIEYSARIARARLGTFQLHGKAVAENRGGNPNVRHGWFGTSKDEVGWIAGGGGFRVQGMPHGDIGGIDIGGIGIGIGGGSSSGFGLQLSSERSASESVLLAVTDGDGLKHVVFCRLIMGNMEQVLPGSKQFRPSSGNFDSGVDNLQSPTRYIIWYPDVNTSILPLYVLSFKLDLRLTVPVAQREPVQRPTSPWISFQALISFLGGVLPTPTMTLVRSFHTEFMERKITRKQLICRIRQLTGDKLLVFAIKYVRNKEGSKK